MNAVEWSILGFGVAALIVAGLCVIVVRREVWRHCVRCKKFFNLAGDRVEFCPLPYGESAESGVCEECRKALALPIPP